LTDPAVRSEVAAATQNLALAALRFLDREALKVEVPWGGSFTPAKRAVRLSVVPTRGGVQRVLAALKPL